MARTPLLRSLLDLARECARAEADPRSSAPVSRRDFLTLAAASAAGVLLDPPEGMAAPHTRRPVVIVGGGISGLTAALRLHDAGVPCGVYEASGRLGGRIFSNSPVVSGTAGFWNDGQVCELGGELIDSGHTTIRA